MSLIGQSRTIGQSLTERFVACVGQYPGHIALSCGGDDLSYSDLHSLALVYAREIEARSIKRLILSITRSPELIALMLACQFRNIPYIPVDTSSGVERLQKIMKITGAHAVINPGKVREFVNSEYRELVVGLDQFVGIREGMEDEGRDLILPRDSELSDSYWIFTSGSTGEPKCVMVGENGCNNLIDSFRDLVQISPAQSWLSTTSLAFDIFYLEYALPLSIGARLILLTDEQVNSPQTVARQLVETRAEVYQSTPSMFKCLVPYLPETYRFNKVLVGGEALTRNIADFLFHRCEWLCNVYGPTETTVWSTANVLKSAGDLRVGRPIFNTQISILNEQGELVNPGEEGKVYIGGAGVTRGYFANNQLSRDRFRSLMNICPEGVIYDTGDIGYIDSEGVLNYVRREGDFYKVNGYRIDPLEIKEGLEAVSGIDEAGAIVHTADDTGESVIVGFYKVGAGNRDLGKEAIFKELARYIASYMTPHHIIPLEEFPYTVSGKLDNGALARLFSDSIVSDASTQGSSLDCASDPIVVELAKYIDVKNLQEEENIFNRGLTSMAAVMLHVDLMKIIPSIELHHIFSHPTVAGIREFNS